MVKKRVIFASIVFLILGGLLLTPAQGATLNSTWATTTPTIDGTIAGGEWDDAASTTFYTYMISPATQKIVFFWAKNNADYLFLRLQWADLTHGGDWDFVHVYFDETNSGDWGVELNNAVVAGMNGTDSNMRDCYVHWDSMLGWFLYPDIASQDGDAAITYNAIDGVYTTEFAIPLGRADTDDMATTAGSLIGIAFLIIDDISDYDLYRYPNNTASVTFQLASAPSGIGISLLPFLVLVFVFLVALDLVRKSRSNLLK